MTQGAMQAAKPTKHLLAVWAVLVVLTIASWWFSGHGLEPGAAVSAILVLTFTKVFLVGHSFMELRRAPRALQTVFGGWCTATCVALIVLATVL